MPASTTLPAPPRACNDACGWATTPAHACTGCACRGAKHGSYLPPAGSVPRRMADPFAGMPLDDDEAW